MVVTPMFLNEFCIKSRDLSHIFPYVSFRMLLNIG